MLFLRAAWPHGFAAQGAFLREIRSLLCVFFPSSFRLYARWGSNGLRFGDVCGLGGLQTGHKITVQGQAFIFA